ncbi:MAG: DUF5717 family protein [Clostridiales bacterium]|nr:DUF5717 family protein [Clostridiales bacterium]
MSQFDYAPPVVKLSVERIRARVGESGAFTIENAGGGKLSGFISSNLLSMMFSSCKFSANSFTARYEIADDAWPGDDYAVIVTTNGGERVIPVSIKPPGRLLSAKSGVCSLDDFVSLAKNDPAKAEKLFDAPEFREWLSDVDERFGLPLNIYDKMKEDVNKARAMDNFLIARGLKRRALVFPEKSFVRLSARPNAAEYLTGEISVKRSEWGYMRKEVKVTKGSAWLEASPSEITAASFKDDKAAVRYRANTGMVSSKAVTGAIIVGNAKVTFFLRRMDVLNVKFSKPFYEFGETGFLQYMNNAGAEIIISLRPVGNLIKFEADSFQVKREGRIPFKVTSSPFAVGRAALSKKPFLTCDLIVKTENAAAPFEISVRTKIGGVE